MSQTHPMIPGVHVSEYTARDWFDSSGKRIKVRARRLSFEYGDDRSCTVYTNARSQTVVVDFFPVEHTETVINMIRDQASWLADQNGGAE